MSLTLQEHNQLVDSVVAILKERLEASNPGFVKRDLCNAKHQLETVRHNELGKKLNWLFLLDLALLAAILGARIL